MIVSNFLYNSILLLVTRTTDNKILLFKKNFSWPIMWDLACCFLIILDFSQNHFYEKEFSSNLALKCWKIIGSVTFPPNEKEMGRKKMITKMMIMLKKIRPYKKLGKLEIRFRFHFLFFLIFISS